MSQPKPQSMCTQEWSPQRTLQSIQEPCVLDLEGSLPFLDAKSSVSTLLDGRAKLSFFPRLEQDITSLLPHPQACQHTL